MIFPADQRLYRWPGYHDPDSKRFIGVVLHPPVWVANTVYGKRGEDDADVFLPTDYKGFYFEVVNPGKSLASEPDYVNETGEETIQEGTSLVVVARAYNLLPVVQNISTDPDSVIITGSNGATVSAQSNTEGDFQFMIDVLPVEARAAKKFTITCMVVLDNGEQIVKELEFRVK